MKHSRRNFLTTIAAAGVVLPFISFSNGDKPLQEKRGMKVRLFSKPLDGYDFYFMCECLAKSGIDGFDLTVRPGGKVEPDHVETLLPKLTDDARKYNIALDMIVTGILSASDPFTERIIKTASATGVRFYRLGWFDYDLKAGIMESLARLREELKKLTELNRKYKIHAGYQNHAGARVGGPVWDLNELLKDLPVEFMGCQYDVRHAMVEGTNTWIFGMHLISGHIKTLAVKDFTWATINGKPQAVTVPLGEGMVDWDLYFKTVREYNLPGPITLHVEYPLLENGQEKLSLSQQQEIIVKKLKKDMDFLNSYLKKYQLT